MEDFAKLSFRRNAKARLRMSIGLGAMYSGWYIYQPGVVAVELDDAKYDVVVALVNTKLVLVLFPTTHKPESTG